MATIKTRAIIVSCLAFGEADLIIKAISQDYGKLSLLAKHARKSRRRFNAGIDIFDRGSLEYSAGKGSLMILRDFCQELAWRDLRTDTRKMVAASLACECFDAMIMEESHDAGRLFSLLSACLEQLESASTANDILHAAAEALDNLTFELGFSAGKEISKQSDNYVHNLGKTMAIVEYVIERKLKTRSSVQDILIGKQGIGI